MISVDHFPYKFIVAENEFPLLKHYAEGAMLYEQIDTDTISRGSWCFVAVARDQAMPFLFLTLRYAPGAPVFSPGILLVKETDTLFIGAGERVLAYDLKAVRHVMFDKVDTGFWGWCLHDDVVIMSAELEIAAWAHNGSKMWSHYAEPPWTYEVKGRTVKLKTFSFEKEFDLYAGPD